MKIMPIIIFLGLVIYLGIFFGSCCSEHSEPKEKEDSFLENTKTEKSSTGKFEYNGGIWSSLKYKIEIVEIDGCQYIIIFGSEGRNIIHKANCNNTIH